MKRDLYINKYFLDKFKIYLFESDKAETTCNLYLDNIIKFIDWFEESEADIFHVTKITTIDIRDYRSYLQSKNEKVSTINNKIASLKSYFSFLYTNKYIIKDPCESIKRLKSLVLPKAKSYDEKTYRAIRREIYRSNNELHICIWELLNKTGIRVSELCNLKLNDITITERTARIQILGKGNKIRNLKLHLDAKNAILDYLKIRNIIIVNNDYLLLSERKCKFTRSAIWKILDKYSSRVGCHISPHQSRHYFCRTLLKNGIDIATVAALAGHSNSLVTAKTYTLSNQEDQDNGIDTL